jgi:hypothetical protein
MTALLLLAMAQPPAVNDPFDRMNAERRAQILAGLRSAAAEERLKAVNKLNRSYSWPQLGSVTPEFARAALPSLKLMIERDGPEARAAAFGVLAQLADRVGIHGSTGAALVPLAEPALRDPDGDAVAAAARLLAVLDPARER